MMRVAAFTGGVAVPSSRFRVRQYIPSLQQHGIFVEEMAQGISKYPPRNKWLRPLWAGGRLIHLLPKVVQSHSFDVVLLQREMLSNFITLESLTKKPRILDVDDAIFLQRDGGFARRLAQISDQIICGNAYLANWFGAWNKHITIIPTAVDTDRYVPINKKAKVKNEAIIGWIGTSGNLKYVYAIEQALAKVLTMRPNAKLRIVSDQKPVFRFIDTTRHEFIPWSEDIEINSIQNMDIGIMPLEESAWARGKCSFKMLQYMSCGLPVVVSPVGMNSEVLAMGDIGIASSSQVQWIDALVELLDSATMRTDMGAEGRRVSVEAFSIHKVQHQLAHCIKGN